MNVQSLASRDYGDNWREFAKDLFTYEDADPGYMLLKRAKLDRDTKLRYVMAWCTFYNPAIAAVACKLQGKEFWRFLVNEYPTAERASERRHFRGRAGLDALASWSQSRPEALIEATYGQTYMDVRKNMKGFAQMGDYFIWKLADVWDTVFDMPVDFTGCEKYMPKVPKQGACLIEQLIDYACFQDDYPPLDEPGLREVMQEITQHIRKVTYKGKAPGVKLALQEAETVCCVFKQHVKGKHRMGSRSVKAYRRLMSVSHLPGHAPALLKGLHAGGIWTPDRLSTAFRVFHPEN
jgi:hypothetical protein